MYYGPYVKLGPHLYITPCFLPYFRYSVLKQHKELIMTIHFMAAGGAFDLVYENDEAVMGPPVLQGLITTHNLLQGSFRFSNLQRLGFEELAQETFLSSYRRFVITHDRKTARIAAKAIEDLFGEKNNKRIVLATTTKPARDKNSDALISIGAAIGAVQIAAPGIYLIEDGLCAPWRDFI